tara:strand:- start:4058 stop:4396 length:339 start_codon:yes stop_codon:yes gene_type:complete
MNNDDYIFMENPMSENWAVRLLTGEWKDVLYVYGKIGLQELHNADSAVLTFNYSILETADFSEDALKYSEDFNNHVGDVLSHILDDSIQNNKFRIGKNERTDANNGFKELIK